MVMDAIGFLIPRSCRVCTHWTYGFLCVWCMFICVSTAVWCIIPVLPVMLHWRWAAGIKRISTDRQWWQTVKWKQSLLSLPNQRIETQANAARQKWLQTNEQTTSPSSPSLADWLVMIIVLRDIRSEQRIVVSLQIMLPLKWNASRSNGEKRFYQIMFFLQRNEPSLLFNTQLLFKPLKRAWCVTFFIALETSMLFTE